MVVSAKIRNPKTTKRLILHAAEAIFAEKGFAGTSIREISEKCGVSGPLILFHYKNKEGIYNAVKASIINRYVEGHSTKTPSYKSIREFVEDLIDSMFSFYRDNPTMMRLANWARLEGDVDPWPGEDELHHTYEEHLRQAQIRGEIRDDISPFHISTIIAGSMHIWWEYHAHFISHAEENEDGTDADEQYARQLLYFVMRGLMPDCSEV